MFGSKEGSHSLAGVTLASAARRLAGHFGPCRPWTGRRRRWLAGWLVPDMDPPLLLLHLISLAAPEPFARFSEIETASKRIHKCSGEAAAADHALRPTINGAAAAS